MRRLPHTVRAFSNGALPTAWFCADPPLRDVRSCRQGTAGASLPGFGVSELTE